MSLILRPLATQTSRLAQTTLPQVSSQMKYIAGILGQIAKRSIHIPPKDQPIYTALPIERFNLPQLLDVAERNFDVQNYDGAIRVCDKILQADSKNEEAKFLRDLSQKTKTDGSLPGF